MSAYVVHATDEVHERGFESVVLHRFLSQERDSITGLRHWVDSPADAEWFSDPHRAHQERLLYGGIVIDTQDFHRIGITSGHDEPGAAGWSRLEVSGVTAEGIGL